VCQLNDTGEGLTPSPVFSFYLLFLRDNERSEWRRDGAFKIRSPDFRQKKFGFFKYTPPDFIHDELFLLVSFMTRIQQS